MKKVTTAIENGRNKRGRFGMDSGEGKGEGEEESIKKCIYIYTK